MVEDVLDGQVLLVHGLLQQLDVEIRLLLDVLLSVAHGLFDAGVVAVKDWEAVVDERLCSPTSIPQRGLDRLQDLIFLVEADGSEGAAVSGGLVL